MNFDQLYPQQQYRRRRRPESSNGSSNSSSDILHWSSQPIVKRNSATSVITKSKILKRPPQTLLPKSKRNRNSKKNRNRKGGLLGKQPLQHLLLITACIFLSLESHLTCALRILLTNDDGLDKPGIQALRMALMDAGHEVYVYAPNVDKTGLGAQIELNVRYTPVDATQTLVEASPATCVIAGLALMNATETIGEPDLVVVGISDGFASGPQTLHSSAVGAAMTAMQRGYPTLAVAGIPTIPELTPRTYFDQVANFTTAFLDTWTTEMMSTFQLMPKGYGLKIGYPGLLAQNVSGVALASDGIYAPISFGYVPSRMTDPNRYQIAPVNSFMEMDDHQNSEFGLSRQGFISVLPISSRLNLPRQDYNVRFILTLRRMIRDLMVQQRQQQ